MLVCKKKCLSELNSVILKDHQFSNAALYTMWKDDGFNISDAYCCKILELP